MFPITRFAGILLVALSLLAGTAVSQDVAAQDPAGEVARLRGEASRGNDSLAVGSQVLVGDTIRSGPGARVEIRFLDESSLTLGENAEIVIDRFFFEARGSRQSIEVLQGVFRFITGAVGKTAPDWVAVRTPVATIGIRGTDFIGGELTVGMPPGQSHYGFQLKDGAVDVVTPAGSVVLDETGEGTFLPLNRLAAPTEPNIWSPEAAAEADNAVAF